MKTLILLVPLILCACGDQQDNRLSAADIAFIKQQQLQALYGTAGATTTATSTVISVVTVTAQSTTTVPAITTVY